MNIVYDDILYSLQKSGGGSVYWTEIIKRAPKNAVHYVYDNVGDNHLYKEENVVNKKLLSSKLLGIKRYFNFKLRLNSPYIFHSSYYRYSKDKTAVNITTVHDFTYEYYRKDLKAIIHKVQKKRAVMHSDGVICISENTKKDLLKFYPKYNGIIKVIHNGFSDKTYTYDSTVEKKNYVLFVGARTAYKRFDGAADILKLLPEMKLVIIGGGALTEQEEAMLNDKIPGRYEKKGFVTEAELVHLYNEAKFLCYPSEYEGFGIPVIEAQACGCPVVCQRNSCIPEVSGEVAVFIDLNKPEEILNSINKLFDEDYYKELQIKGIENAKKYSWDKCGEQVQEFYKQIMDEKINNKK